MLLFCPCRDIPYFEPGQGYVVAIARYEAIGLAFLGIEGSSVDLTRASCALKRKASSSLPALPLRGSDLGGGLADSRVDALKALMLSCKMDDLSPPPRLRWLRLRRARSRSRSASPPARTRVGDGSGPEPAG